MFDGEIEVVGACLRRKLARIVSISRVSPKRVRSLTDGLCSSSITRTEWVWLPEAVVGILELFEVETGGFNWHRLCVVCRFGDGKTKARDLKPFVCSFVNTKQVSRQEGKGGACIFSIGSTEA